MATAVVSVLVIALVVLGGMTMAQGILTSADSTALSVEGISVRQGEINRTALAGDTASLPAPDDLRLTLDNSGQTKLAGYDKWDFIVQYYDAGDNYHVTWLPHTTGALGDNQWQETGLYLDGAPEAFEPNILNPGEQIALEAKLEPPAGYRAVVASVATPNGVAASDGAAPVIVIGPPVLTAHTETVTMGANDYYMEKGFTAADGTAITESTDALPKFEMGRWLLHNQADPGRLARHLFPLSGVNEIRAATWTVYYRAQATGNWYSPWGTPRMSIDVLVRQADGTLRGTIVADAAEAPLTLESTWETVAGTYDFPGYTVVDDTDYLEIDYYAECYELGAGTAGAYIMIRVDDDTLPVADQTRISGLDWG